jgi:putative tryptophan/tyrosine transport system substrate-binding protein
MRRREFIFGGAAAAWPVVARAQQVPRARRIGALMPEPESYPESRARVVVFEQRLSQLGWKVGQSLTIDYRWEVSSTERARAAATDLVGLSPDLILSVATPATLASKQTTQTIPVVFVAVTEPVAQGIVPSLAHPGGNITGFTNLEASFGAKWLQLLKEIAPQLTNVTIAFNPDTVPFAIPFASNAQAAGSGLNVVVDTVAVRGQADIEALMARVAARPGQNGMIFPPDPYTAGFRKLIVDLAIRHRLPAIYGLKFFATEDGLAFYGIDIVEVFRRAAEYVDRVLRGEKPADLPVQQPTQFEFILNLKAAKAIGLEVPPLLVARANEVIE